MSDFGQDAAWVTDAASARFPWAPKRLGLAQSIARRFSQPEIQSGDPDAIEFWPGYGFALAVAIDSHMSDARIRMYCERQCIRDERVSAAQVHITRDNGVALVRVNITPIDDSGSFDFVLTVADAKVKLLSLEGIAVNG